MLNSCNFIGIMGKDPETKTTKDGASSFATFSLAVNKPGASRDEKTLWLNVTAFKKTGEFVTNYLKKGSKVFVQGPIEVNEFEGKDGNKHTSIRLLANTVLSLNSKEGGSSDTKKTEVNAPATTVADEDIPF